MQGRKWENEYRTTMICIDSYEKSVPVGRFYNPHYPDGVRFHGVIELIKKMEQMLDQMRFPQSFSSVRTFAGAPVVDSRTPAGEIPQEGELATLAVRVLFRQNASWQGSVLWLEGGREESFRSLLELLFLLDSAVCAESISR